MSDILTREQKRLAEIEAALASPRGQQPAAFDNVLVDRGALRWLASEVARLKAERRALVEAAVRAGMESVLQEWVHGSHNFQETETDVTARVLEEHDVTSE